jgi:hypothetical protein
MRSSPVVPIFVSILFLALFALALYYLVGFGAGLFAGVGPEVTTVTVAAAITLLVCASIIAGGLHGIGRREDVRQQRAVRAAVYEQFLRAQAGTARGGALPLGDRRFVAGDVQDLEPQMLLVASAEVLKAYRRWRRAQEGAADGTATPQQAMASLVRAMRRDLGHRAPDLDDDAVSELMRTPSRQRA